MAKTSPRRANGLEPPRSPVRYYKTGGRVNPYTVVYVNNRPGRRYGYEARVARVLDGLDTLQFNKIPFDTLKDATLRDRLPALLEDGFFRDTTKIAQCLGAFNEKFRLDAACINPLELLVVNAEEDIERLLQDIIEQGNVPAGIVFSGSRLMLNESLDSPMVQMLVRLARHALEKEIPTLGICFGFHLLCYVKWGILPAYNTVPEDMKCMYFPRRVSCLVDKASGDRREITLAEPGFVDLKPGQRWPVFGPHIVRRLQADRFLNQVDSTWAIEIHWQSFLALRPPMSGGRRLSRQHIQQILSEACGIETKSILASSRRVYRPHQNAPREDHICEEIVEAVRLGKSAVACQGHPELKALLAWALTYDDEIRDLLLGHGRDLDLDRRRLLAHDDTRPNSAARLVYNNVVREIGPQYLADELERGHINDESLAVLTGSDGRWWLDNDHALLAA